MTLSSARARNPEAPWLWRRDWAAGKIEDGNRTTMVFAWMFAGLWNLISLPSAVLGVRQALRQESYGVLFVLLFPLVGIGLLVWAIRATLRFRRYGISRFDIATVPAPVGRSLKGTVVARGLDAHDGVLLTLTCVRRVVTGSGKNRSTSERVLWQEERRSEGRQTRTAEGMATAIPVDFALPPDGEPTDGRDPRDRIVWRLAVTAAVPGVDYASIFEVPVFRTAESTSVAPVETPPAPAEPFGRPASSRITVTRNRRGTEIAFPPARNPRASAGLSVFLVLWLGATWATAHFRAPLLFQIVFGGFGLILFWLTAASWLGVSRVTVGDGLVTVATGWVTAYRERRFATADIAEVTTKIGMQAGNTPYYDIVLVGKDGRKTPAAHGIRDKREAEWLASTIRGALQD